MKSKVLHPVYGEIIYDENFWTGSKSLYVNGVKLNKISKNTFGGQSDFAPIWTVSGNVISGVKVVVNGETIVVDKKPAWYDIVLSSLIFILIMIWGNSVALCSIVPVIGGAIGGGISGIMLATNLIIIKKQSSILKKILITLGMMAATFVICMLAGFAYLGAIAYSAIS